MSPEARRIKKWWYDHCEGVPDRSYRDYTQQGFDFGTQGYFDERIQEQGEWFEGLSSNCVIGSKDPSRRMSLQNLDIEQALCDDEKADQIMESLTQEDVENLPPLDKPFRDLIEFVVIGGSGGSPVRGGLRYDYGTQDAAY